MFPLQAGQGAPFMGRLVNVKRSEDGVFISIPADMLNDAGIADGDRVEVWGMLDGTLSFRIATKCDLCSKGARLYELQIGNNTKKVCYDDYIKLMGTEPLV